MKGKYITTSLKLAVLSGGNHGASVLVSETKATTENHMLIWSKTVATAKKAMNKMQQPDELKTQRFSSQRNPCFSRSLR